MLPGYALLDHLRARGLAVRRDGDRVLVSPATLLSPEDAGRIREGKAELLEALRDEERIDAWLASQKAQPPEVF